MTQSEEILNDVTFLETLIDIQQVGTIRLAALPEAPICPPGPPRLIVCC